MNFSYSCFRIFTLFALLVWLCSSCSLQKRHYMQGYHVQWNVENVDVPESQSGIAEKAKEEIEFIGKMELTASLRGGAVLLPEKAPALLDNPATSDQSVAFEECDIIVQRNGQEIKVKVTEINPVNIKYKKCDDPVGQELSISKAEVERIKYSNGTVDEFPKEQQRAASAARSISQVETKVKKLSKLSLLFGILSFIPLYGAAFGVAAIILGAIALHKYKENGIDDPKAKKKATIGLLLGIGGILLTIGIGIWLIADLLII